MPKDLKQAIIEFVVNDDGNALKDHGGMQIYSEPLVAYASAADPLFQKLREPEVDAPEHKMPQDWVAQAKTVISYFLPFSEPVRASNRKEGFPSEEWCSARIDGEDFNNKVRRFVEDQLRTQGFQAVAPVLTKEFTANYYITSNWSERHVAYIAGLGTFGLSRSLITPKGSAGRFGSIVTDMTLEPSPREEGPYYSGCPWLMQGECGDCIDRCPSGAITEKGKDKVLCSKHLHEVIVPKFHPKYGCAKCQTGVSCEAGIP